MATACRHRRLEPLPPGLIRRDAGGVVGCRHERDIARRGQPTRGRRPCTWTRRRPHAARQRRDTILNQDGATILIGGGASQLLRSVG